MRRRIFLQIGTGTMMAIAAHGCTPSNSPQATTSSASPASSTAPAAENPGKIVIAYPTIAAGLPFFYAVEKGLFKDAGLDVEAQKVPSPQQIVEGMIAGRIQGCSNGTATGSLAVADAASPGLFRIIASNPTNSKYVLDQVIVAKDSPIQSIADLKGKKVGCGPGPQNQAIAKGLLEKNGVTDAEVIQLDISQHPNAVASGQLAAAYTLEPIGTLGQLKGLTRTLESGVVAKYILGDPMAPWFGGSAALTTKFIQAYPETTKKYINVYRQAVDVVRKTPDAARPFLEKYTPIKGNLIQSVPIPNYQMYDELSASDLEYFQKFFDFLQQSGVLSKKVEAAPLIYKPA
ncbi:ABC transporter substrate-binding protein [Leptolyngbya sp. AN03gr2]|uniref:ABC transporter substrate-binding protein n=1 Tax=unclassified Leptolyngbya TaxID=2650499 RepID=UPI003D323FA5